MGECTVCGATECTKPLYAIERFEIGRCSRCQMVYLSNPPSRQELEDLYSIGYFEGDLSKRGYQSYGEDRVTLEKNFRMLLRKILKSAFLNVTGTSSPGKLLEIGSAYGFFLNLAREHFESVQGVEFSSEAAKYARDELNLDVQTGDLQDCRFPDEAFDVVAMWDVIEHLQDPRAVVKKIYRLIKPGGDLYLTTGNVESLYARLAGKRWRLINPPQHIFYFSPRTLTKLFESEGFEVIQARPHGKYVSISFIAFILSYLFGSSWFERFKSSRAGRSLAGHSIYLNLFDVTLLHARKKRV